jgi:hypothetical protein
VVGDWHHQPFSHRDGRRDHRSSRGDTRDPVVPDVRVTRRAAQTTSGARSRRRWSTTTSCSGSSTQHRGPPIGPAHASRRWSAILRAPACSLDDARRTAPRDRTRPRRQPVARRRPRPAADRDVHRRRRG